MTNKKVARGLTATLVLGLAAILVFYPGLQGGFLFDDLPNLVEAEGWKVSSLNQRTWLEAMRSGQTSDRGRPLAMLSFAVNHWLTALDPWWLKATNLLFHLINGVLAWRLSRHLMKVDLPLRLNQGELAAVLIAAAWMVHPLQASTVLYTVQRMEIGAATGALWSLLAYVRLRQAQLSGSRAWPWGLIGAIGLLFALGFKESAAIIPVLALILEAAQFRFRHRHSAISRGWVSTYAVLTFAGMLAFLHIALPLTSAEAYAARGFSASERVLTQGPVLAMYVQQILLPLPDSLRFYYDAFPVTHNLTEPRSLKAWTFILAMVLLAVVVRRRWRLTTFGIAWFFACHAITSGPIPLELAFEHRNYLALLGLLLAVVPPLQTLGQRLHDDARVVLAATPVLALAVLGALAASTWGDPLRLAWALENRNSNSPRATYALAVELLDMSQGDVDSPTWAMGIALLERARSLPTSSALPTQALIVMRSRHSQNVDPVLWADFRRRLAVRAIDAEGIEALYAVSNCRIASACNLDDGELLHTFLTVVQTNPHNATVHTLYADFAWNVLVDENLALRVQRQAVRLEPTVQMRAALAKFLLASAEPSHTAEGGRLLEQLQAEELSARLDSELTALKHMHAGHPQ